MSRRGRILSDQDLDAWNSFSRHVAPLHGRPATADAAVKDTGPGSLPARAPRSPWTRTPDLVVGERGLGLDDSSWRALSSGRMTPARRLDLHGRTADAAFAELHAFLVRASAERLRCVEIITGRGAGESGGVLRRELPHWLNRTDLRPLIIAAQHPQPGNLGAVRILLRRPRRPAA